MSGMETTLAQLAVEYWKLLRMTERTIEMVPDATKERIASQARFSASRLEVLLREQKMSLQSFDGMDFEANLPASAVNGDEFSDGLPTSVERTLEPAVVSDMRVVLAGKVLLMRRG